MTQIINVPTPYWEPQTCEAGLSGGNVTGGDTERQDQCVFGKAKVD